MLWICSKELELTRQLKNTMDKAFIEKQIESLKANIKLAEDNVVGAINHVEEGKLILKAYEEKLKEFS